MSVNLENSKCYSDLFFFCRYKWVLEKSNNVFKITPNEGISLAHSEIVFTVTFYAVELYQFYKGQVRIKIFCCYRKKFI